MSVTEFGEVLDDYGRRIQRVEQITTGTAMATAAPEGDNEFEEGVIIGTGPDAVLVDLSVPDTPASVTLATGANFDVSFIDVEWQPPAEAGNVTQYQVEISRKEDGNYLLSHLANVVGTSFRYEPVEPGATYGVRVYAVTAIGKLSVADAFIDIVAGVDSTIPPAPANLVVYAGYRTITVLWSDVASEDVIGGRGYYEVELDTANTFPAPISQRVTGVVTSFNNLTVDTPYYVRVRAVDSSGNLGPWSTVASGTPGKITGTTEIANGTIVNDHIAAAGITAAKITFGTMSGDRIQANTLDANKLMTSTLTATTITLGSGGQIRIGNPPTSGIYINSMGVRAYKAGVQTFSLDSDGTAVFSGTVSAATIAGGTVTGTAISGGSVVGTWVRTADTGTRVELDPAGVLRFYDSSFSASQSVGLLYGGSQIMWLASETRRLFLQGYQGVNIGSNTGNIVLQAGPGGNPNYQVQVNGTLVTNNWSYNYGGSYFYSSVRMPGILASAAAYYVVCDATANVNLYKLLASSSERFKERIVRADDNKLDRLNGILFDLDPVTFFWKEEMEQDDGEQFGFIAERVEEALGESASYFVNYDADGNTVSLKYDRMWIPLIDVIKKLSDRVAVLEAA